MSPEDLGFVGLIPIIAFFIFFAVLGFLVPWFVWRNSIYNRETRDLVRDVKISLLRANSHLDEANRHLATMAHDSK